MITRSFALGSLGVICLFIAFWHWPQYAHVTAQSKVAFASGKIDHKTEIAECAAAFVDFVGSSAYWFLGGFLCLTACMNVNYENTNCKSIKGGLLAISGGVLLLALKSFFYADECAKFFSEENHGQYFSQIVDVRIASSLVILFVGRIFFEMVKPIFTK